MKLTQSELDALLRKNKAVTVEKPLPWKNERSIYDLGSVHLDGTQYSAKDPSKPPISQPEAKEGGSVSLYIDGIPPSKKNSKQIISIPTKSGKRRPMIISSKAYKEWEKWAIGKLSSQYEGALIDWPICVHFIFFYKDKRIWDLNNKIEGILDSMRGIIIKDDHRFIVSKLIVEQQKDVQAGVSIQIRPFS